jgi:hypothetical protein
LLPEFFNVNIFAGLLKLLLKSSLPGNRLIFPQLPNLVVLVVEDSSLARDWPCQFHHVDCYGKIPHGETHRKRGGEHRGNGCSKCIQISNPNNIKVLYDNVEIPLPREPVVDAEDQHPLQLCPAYLNDLTRSLNRNNWIQTLRENDVGMMFALLLDRSNGSPENYTTILELLNAALDIPDIDHISGMDLLVAVENKGVEVAGLDNLINKIRNGKKEEDIVSEISPHTKQVAQFITLLVYVKKLQSTHLVSRLFSLLSTTLSAALLEPLQVRLQ